MTTALYRRYRPDTFQEVIGQEHVTAPLMAALRADRVTHAYLFSGPRGCGKTTSARILARCLNCEQFPTDTPCGECPSCRDLATGGPGSLDVVEIDAASHNGVDDARDLRERASFAPARDRFKIFILDEAHMVTPQGFNALLKLVEEPPPHVKFIFATTEPEKVIGTIRSRTHHYPFRLVPPDILEHYLAQLTEAEGVRVGPGVFPLVTRAGGGSVRDTLSVLDQLIGGASDGEISYQTAVSLLGYTDATMLDQCIDAIAAADGAGVFRVVDRLVESGHDPRRFVEDLLQRLRDLLVIALAGAEAGPALGSLPADQLERMQRQARTLGSGALSRYADITAQALQQMVGATSPRLQLELLMARLVVANGQGALSSPTPSGGVPTSVPASPAGEGIREVASSSPATDAPEPQTSRTETPREAAPAQPVVGQQETEPATEQAAEQTAEPATESVDIAANAPAPQAASGSAEAEMLRTRWPEVLDAVRRERMATWALLKQHAQPGSIIGGVFSLRFTSAGLIGTFTNGGHLDVVSRAIEQALGLKLELRGELAAEGAPAAAAPTAPAGAATALASSEARTPQAAPASTPSASASGQARPNTQPTQEEPRPFERAAAEPAPPNTGWGEVAQIGRKLRQAEAAAGEASPAVGEGAGRTPTPAGSASNADPAGAPVRPAAPVEPPVSEQTGMPAGSTAPGQASAPSNSGSLAEAHAQAQPAGAVPEGAASVSDSGQASGSDARDGNEVEENSEPLATVHRLHKLPDLPASARPAESVSQADSTPQATPDPSPVPESRAGHGPQSELVTSVVPPSQATQDAPALTAPPTGATFSDGVPIPDEPRDYDGPPEDEGFVPADNEALFAARAAARAAARGEALPAQAAATTRLEDDIPSEDDEDADDAGMVGLDVIKRMLGAVVLEDRTINPEERYV